MTPIVFDMLVAWAAVARLDGSVGLDVWGMILGVAFWAAGTYFAIWAVPDIWRNPERARRQTAALTGFPFGSEVRRGLVRGSVLNTANMFLLGAGLQSGALWEQQGSPDHGILFWTVLTGIALVLVSVMLGLLIIWFNAPKWLVPPHMRDELGLVTRKQRGRDLGRR